MFIAIPETIVLALTEVTENHQTRPIKSVGCPLYSSNERLRGVDQNKIWSASLNIHASCAVNCLLCRTSLAPDSLEFAQAKEVLLGKVSVHLMRGLG